MIPNQLFLSHIVFVFLFLLLGCNEFSDTRSTDTIRVQSPSEPDIINPVISRKSISSTIESHIYLPLVTTNPSDGSWTPILLKGWNTEKEEGKIKYTLNFRNNAHWNDGEKIGPEDLFFTIKMALNPYLKNKAWAPYMSLIEEVDAKNNEAIITLSEPYILADEFIASMTLYPYHVFDPEGTFRKIKLKSFTEGEFTKNEDSILRRTADAFNVYGNVQSPGQVTSGPYELEGWVPGQSMTLTKVDNWWGEQVQDNGSFNYMHWDTLQYIFIEDQQNAINTFINGQVDFLSSVDREDSSVISSAGGKIVSVPTLQLLYIAVNNQQELLSQPSIRKALSMGINRADLIRRLFHRDTKPVFGPIHPDKPYFRDYSSKYDPDRALDLLNRAGCRDLDNDGVLDCKTAGETKALEFEIWTTRSDLSRKVATLLKSYWQRIGVSLTIQSADFGTFLPELQNKTFDFATLALRQNNIKDDPYPLWHSSQAKTTGKNYQGVIDKELDSILVELRESLNVKDQKRLYQDFQKRFAALQPAFFLVAPYESVALKDNIELFRIKERPGYDISRSGLKVNY